MRYLYGILMLLVLSWTTSCGPVVNLLDVDVKIPANRPLSLENRSIAVFQAYKEGVTDSVLLTNFSKGFKERLEKDLQLNTGSIPLFQYSIHPEDDSLLLDPLYLESLCSNTAASTVFFIDSLCLGNFQGIDRVKDFEEYRVQYVYVPVKAFVRAFDPESQSIVKDLPTIDTLFWEILANEKKDRITIPKTAYTDLLRTVPILGSTLASDFSSQWETQERILYSYSSKNWNKALDYAEKFEWAKAQKIWMECLETNNLQMYACACFNLAVASEMMGDITLAKDWLALSKRNWNNSLVKEYESTLTIRSRAKNTLLKVD